RQPHVSKAHDRHGRGPRRDLAFEISGYRIDDHVESVIARREAPKQSRLPGDRHAPSGLAMTEVRHCEARRAEAISGGRASSLWRVYSITRSRISSTVSVGE